MAAQTENRLINRVSGRVPGWLGRVCLMLSLLLGGGCTVSPPYYKPAEPLSPRAQPVSEITCAEDNVDRCAQRSPLLELADRAVERDTHVATILDVGRQALEVRINLIRAARRSIDLQTYIWANDESGQLIIRELIAAARRGVKVRILSDQLRDGVTAEYLARLAVTHVNLEKKIYNPFLGDAVMDDADYVWGTFFHFDVLNHRMHCKLLAVDGQIAIVGGRNIQNRYFDLDPAFDFIDRDVLVAGPVVASMTRSFDEYWHSPIVASLDQLADVRARLFSGADVVPLPAAATVVADSIADVATNASDADYIRTTFVESAHEVHRIVFTVDRPMKPFIKHTAEDLGASAALREVVAGARDSLVVQTPYPILSSSAYKALHRLRKQNPGIEFTLSTNSLASADHVYVYALAFKRKKRNVKQLGFNIYELKNAPRDAAIFVSHYVQLGDVGVSSSVSTQPARGGATDDGFLDLFPDDVPRPRISIHAKSLVVDERVAVIGSHNFDPRSRDINTENAVIIWDEAFAAALGDRIRLATRPENSWVIAKSENVPVIGHVTGLIGTMSRLLPVFDVWPFRWTSSFELRPGMAPVPPGDPAFYKHYEDVGQFPGMGLDIEQLEVHLVSGFLSVAEPFM